MLVDALDLAGCLFTLVPMLRLFGRRKALCALLLASGLMMVPIGPKMTYV